MDQLKLLIQCTQRTQAGGPPSVGHDVKTCKVWTTHDREDDNLNASFYNAEDSQLSTVQSLQGTTLSSNLNIDENLQQINWSEKIDQVIKKLKKSLILLTRTMHNSETFK